MEGRIGKAIHTVVEKGRTSNKITKEMEIGQTRTITTRGVDSNKISSTIRIKVVGQGSITTTTNGLKCATLKSKSSCSRT